MPKLLRSSLTALCAAAALGAGTAGAVPIVNWEYQISGQFTSANFTAGGGSQSIGPTDISWGGSAASDRSNVGITATPRNGTVATDGDAVPANTYTHFNNPIDGSYATLSRATILATLSLREQIPGGGNPYSTASTSYDIYFAETPNEAPCAATSPQDNPCNDIWVIRGSLNRTITVGDYEYFFSFYAEPALATLPPLACGAANVAAGCIGFTTVEGQPNAVNFLLEVTSERIGIPGEVPEPSSIALLGAGLLGLVALRRRSTRKA